MKKFYSIKMTSIISENCNAIIKVDNILYEAFIDENLNAFVPFGVFFEFYTCSEFDLEQIIKPV